MKKTTLSSLIFLTILLILCQGAISGDLNAFYSMDYEGFWEHWNETKNNAIACNEPQKLSMFLSNSLVTLKNSEVTEANAEVIETLALKNPECLLRGIHKQTIENQNKIIKNFLILPIFKETKSIENSLKRIWDKNQYKNLETRFNEIKKHS